MKEAMKISAPNIKIKPILLFSIVFVFPLLVPQQAARAGDIEFLYHHPATVIKYLHGRVWDVTPANYKVAVYIRVGGWWTKPSWEEPLTTIGSDGLFSCDVDNQPSDYLADRFAAFLVPNGYDPPLGSGQSSLPGELYSYPYQISSDLQSNPAWVEFTYIPPYGSYVNLRGHVSGVTPADYKVAVYIRVANTWWTKPYSAQPLTTINANSTWTCDITTGGSDNLADRIAAFLLPNGYSPPIALGVPYLDSELYTYPYAETPRTIVGNTISFAGYNWSVKESSSLVGPGPNYFSANPADVWVDGSGHLHMNIVYRAGKWYCTEVIVDDSPGYGTYVFTTQNRVDLFDRNVVLGLFTWDSSAGQYNYREIDFEFSTWGNPALDNSQFVIQPGSELGNIHRFDINYSGPTNTTTHVMTWAPDGITFRSYYGDFSLLPPPANLISSWIYTGPDNPPPGAQNARINFWLMSGLPPTDGLDEEVVITDFQYLPDLTPEIDLPDFARFANHYQQTACGTCSGADFTDDGRVKNNDLAWIVASWLDLPF